MWVLEQEYVGKFAGQRRYILCDRQKYIVGRLGADIVLPMDSSISRRHAFVHIVDDKIYMEDNNSKYGTFYNSTVSTSYPMKPGERKLMNAGDRVRFGLLRNVWLISKRHYVVLASTLSPSQLSNLESQIPILGGHMEDIPIPTCTHLTMDEGNLTPKLLFALVKNIPVVTCEFWTKLIAAAKENKAMPEEKDFLPKPSDDVCFDAYPQRQQLFNNYIFIFLDPQMDVTYTPIVVAAGGQVVQLMEDYKEQVLQQNIIVMEYLAANIADSSQLFHEVNAYLQLHGRRTIPDYEIALAIMNCDISRWCNTYQDANSNPASQAKVLESAAGIADSIDIQKMHEEQTIEDVAAEVELESEILKEEEIETNNNLNSMPHMRVTESILSTDTELQQDEVSKMDEEIIEETNTQQQQAFKRKRLIENTDTLDSDDDYELIALSNNKRAHNEPTDTEQRPVTPQPLAREQQPVFVVAQRARPAMKSLFATETVVKPTELANVSDTTDAIEAQARREREQAADAMRASKRAEVRAQAEARAAARARREAQQAYAEIELNFMRSNSSSSCSSSNNSSSCSTSSTSSTSSSTSSTSSSLKMNALCLNTILGKRTRLAILSEDETEDNLFEFDCTTNKRSKAQLINKQQKQHDDHVTETTLSDDEIFKKPQPKPKPKEPIPEVESLFEFDLLAKSKGRNKKERHLDMKITSTSGDYERPSTSRAALASMPKIPLKEHTDTAGWLQKKKAETVVKPESLATQNLNEQPIGMRTIGIDLTKTRVNSNNKAEKSDKVYNTEVLNPTIDSGESMTANLPSSSGTASPDDNIYANVKVFRKSARSENDGCPVVETKMQKL